MLSKMAVILVAVKKNGVGSSEEELVGLVLRAVVIFLEQAHYVTMKMIHSNCLRIKNETGIGALETM